VFDIRLLYVCEQFRSRAISVIRPNHRFHAIFHFPFPPDGAADRFFSRPHFISARPFIAARGLAEKTFGYFQLYEQED